LKKETIQKEGENRDKLSKFKEQHRNLEKEYHRAKAKNDGENSKIMNEIKDIELRMSMSSFYEQEIQRSKVEQLSAKIECKREEKSFHLWKFWETAFNKNSSGIVSLRSFLFEQFVEDLNSVLASYSDKFSGADHLGVTFSSTMKPNESYGTRSGGERRRTDLVALFSMYELVRGATRYNANFLFLDEVFDTLDKSGQRDVQNILKALINHTDKVFLVSHSNDITTGLSLAGSISCTMNRQNGIRTGSSVTVLQ